MARESGGPPPDGPGDRRTHPRLPAQPPVPCWVRVQGYDARAPRLAGTLRNIAAGGAMLEAARRLPPGAQVTLVVETARGFLEVEGEVIWVTGGGTTGEGPLYVHGVQFPAAEGAADPALEDLLHHVAALRPVVPDAGPPPDR